MNDLLERSLPEETEQEILSVIGEVPGINNPHDLRTRRVGNSYAIEAHVRVDRNMTVWDAHELTRQIEVKLRERFGESTHISIHVEPLGSD